MKELIFRKTEKTNRQTDRQTDGEKHREKPTHGNDALTSLQDLIYSILLHQPAGGEFSLTKYARKHFKELLELVESNVDEVQGRRAAQTSGTSTPILSPTEKCVRQISVVIFFIFH